MAHSTMVPHVATIPTDNVVVSQAPIGTPLSSRPSSSLPLGYKALNPFVVNTTQVTPISSIPLQQPGGTSLGGYNPSSGTGQSFTSYFQIPGTQPHAGGNLLLEGNLHSGVLHMILVTLEVSLQVMCSGSHKDFLPEKDECSLLPKNTFLR
jgi:hypothetical protein